jgi:glycosyltransferase involved in cell wall biosynthesis
LKKRSILIFAPYFPPRLRVGAIRPYRFAKYLSGLGWDVTVISIANYDRDLTEIQKKDLENVKLIKLEPPFDNTVSKSNQSNDSVVKKKGSNFLINWVDRNFPLDTWLPFFYSKRNQITNIIKEIEPDIIWSTSDPWSGGYVIGKIAKKLGKKWIADFRDPWTLCSVRFEKKNRLSSYFDKRAEKWIVQNADHLTFTAKATENKYRSFYNLNSDKTTNIYNSFDADINANQSDEQSISKETFDIFFMGSFRELSTARLIIEILGKIKSSNRVVFDQIKVHSYGDFIEKDFELASKYDVLSSFNKRDKVPFSKVQSEISKADLLLLSTHPERDDIVPAKLWDYLLSGKPILSLVQNPEINEILEETNTGKQFHLNELDNAVNFIIESVQSETVYVNQKTSKKELIKKYSASETSKELSELLKRVITDV